MTAALLIIGLTLLGAASWYVKHRTERDENEQD